MSHEEIVEATPTHRVVIALEEHDTSHANPRDNSNLGVMWCKHRDYALGDDAAEIDDLSTFVANVQDFVPSASEMHRALVKHLQRAHGATVVLPLYLLDHSGITISAGHDLMRDPQPMNRADHFACDSGGWDTSFVGFIFDTARTRDECGTPLDKVRKFLDGEVRTYASYLEGDVWSYRIEEHVSRRIQTVTTWSNGTVEHDERVESEWVEVDSCHGFIGHRYAVEEAKDAFSGYREAAA